MLPLLPGIRHYYSKQKMSVIEYMSLAAGGRAELDGNIVAYQGSDYVQSSLMLEVRDFLGPLTVPITMS